MDLEKMNEASTRIYNAWKELGYAMDAYNQSGDLVTELNVGIYNGIRASRDTISRFMHRIDDAIEEATPKRTVRIWATAKMAKTVEIPADANIEEWLADHE